MRPSAPGPGRAGPARSVTNHQAAVGGPITPPGEAAISVFRLEGPETAHVLSRVFHPRGSGPLLPDQLRVGHLRTPDGQVLDEAVLRTGGADGQVPAAAPWAPG